MRELGDRRALAAALTDARDYTLRVYAHLDETARRFPYGATVNPPLWELAHVAWFQEHWCLRWRDGAAREPSLLPDADAMLNSALIPHRARWDLPQLDWPAVDAYLRRVLEMTLERLERTPAPDPYFFLLSLFHEDMHAEAYRMSLQTLALPGPAATHAAAPSVAPLRAREFEFAGGTLLQGSVPGRDFVFDNELRAHESVVAPFALAACTVTQGEYRAFVDAGGYEDERLWSVAGWRWRSAAGATHPRYWRREGADWVERRFDRWETVDPAAAMVHVCAHEAEACAAFMGARLPTEVEWEYAARAMLPAGGDRYPWGDLPLPAGSANLDLHYGAPVSPASLPAGDAASGLRQMLGNVWEWTASPFGPYPGFEPGPYKEYSQPWFGDHRVLRGGSFATRARLVHSRWRNFYTPDRGDAYAGFRLARSLPD